MSWPIENTFMWVHTITTAETMSQGSQPCQGDISLPWAFGARSPPPPEPRVMKRKTPGRRAGFQIRRKASVATSAVSDESTSVSA